MAKISVCILVAVVAVVMCLGTSYAAGNCHQFGINIKQGKTVSAPVGQCLRIKCINAKNNEIGATPCPAFQPGPGCRVSHGDLTKRFPDCCPKPIC